MVLLAGEPGVGKSTLLLEVAAKAATRVLYVTGEESAAQVRLRAERTGALRDELYLAAESDLGAVLGHLDELQPDLLIVDSIQTMSTADADGAPGGVTQTRAVTVALTGLAKERGLPVLLVGHARRGGSGGLVADEGRRGRARHARPPHRRRRAGHGPGQADRRVRTGPRARRRARARRGGAAGR